MSLPIAAPSDDRGFPPDLAITIYSGDGLCVQRDPPRYFVAGTPMTPT
jgi:hypothetical protein